MKISIIDNNWIKQQAYRLDASVFDPDVLSVVQSINKYPSKTTIGEIADVWMPGRFKRYRTDQHQYGIPFLTASQILLVEPSKSEFISKKLHKDDLVQLLPKEGTILVTRSGTIGNCALVTKYLSEFAVSEDAIRVEAKDSDKRGYIYTYLSSQFGQTLLTRDKYGSVIDHIEPFHIQEIPIPNLPNDSVNIINHKAISAWEKRQTAHDLSTQLRRDMVYNLDLPPLRRSELYIHASQRIYHLDSDTLDLRLDASFYDPPGREALRLIQERTDCKLLDDVTKKIFHPFQMNMVLVNKKHGAPFLGGSDIVRFRYFGDKFISSITADFENYRLDKGWTLITRSGTIGRTSYVSDYIDGYAASSHVIRVVPDETKVLTGYLFAFLSSDYAQYQIENLIYGSVVDQVRESQLRTILLPVPSLETQQIIHEMVKEVYRLRYEANCLEDEAQTMLSEALGLSENKHG